MDYHDIKVQLFSAVNKNDPHRASKELQIKNWCYSFLICFSIDGRERIPFFIDILSDEECWEKTDSIHRVKLNRQITAKKMIQEQSWKGRANPLETLERYLVACVCCLKDDIASIFQQMKEISEIRDGDTIALRKLVKFLSLDKWTNPLIGYWSHIVGGYATELDLKCKHLYEYGLNLAIIHTYVGHVEAVEYFWNKIKSLSEDEMNTQQKDEIFMKAAVRSTGTNLRRFPEIFEFCIRQISPDKYPEVVQRDFSEHCEYGSLVALQDNLCFDMFQKLFDYFRPDDVSKNKYYRWLTSLEMEAYSEYYLREAVKLFMHMWQKEGFNKHRLFVLKNELIDFHYRGTLLVPFVKLNFMEPVWAILDRACQDHINLFMESGKAGFICYVLKKRGDNVSLNKFLSYKSANRELRNAGDSNNVNLSQGLQTKRPRME